jgi:hypothetical protein
MTLDAIYHDLFLLALGASGDPRWQIRAGPRTPRDERTLPQLPDLPDTVDGIRSAVSSAMTYLGAYRKERARQAAKAFNLAMCVTVAGVVLVLLGVFLMFIVDNRMVGVISSGAGIVTSIVGAIGFYLYRDASQRLDRIGDAVGKIEAIAVGVSLVEKISSKKRRDEAYLELARVLCAIIAGKHAPVLLENLPQEKDQEPAEPYDASDPGSM